MIYENPPVPHEVNVGRESALREFLRLAAGLALAMAVAASILWAAGGWLARRIPFATEAAWVGDAVIGIDDAGAAGPPGLRAYLQELADALAARMDLPAGMRVKVHVADSEVANAFATLGGHVVVTRGLYRRMPNENALSLVLAHEIGHLRERDPISALGGGATLTLLFALVGGDAGALLPKAARLVTLGHSRSAERRADRLALAALRARYGHARGAGDVFRILARARDEVMPGRLPTLLSTHPADEERIARMQAAEDEAGPDATTTPLRIAPDGA